MKPCGLCRQPPRTLSRGTGRRDRSSRVPPAAPSPYPTAITPAHRCARQAASPVAPPSRPPPPAPCGGRRFYLLHRHGPRSHAAVGAAQGPGAGAYDVEGLVPGGGRVRVPSAVFGSERRGGDDAASRERAAVPGAGTYDVPAPAGACIEAVCVCVCVCARARARVWN